MVDFETIETLEFINSQVSYIPTDLIKMLPNLQRLIMRNVSLIEIKSSDFEEKSNLVEINLSYNQLTVIPSNLFNNDDELLEILDLSHNSIVTVEKDAFSAKNLRIINLKSNKIKHFDCSHCEYLTLLDLSQNLIKDIEPIYKLINMETLYLDNNKIEIAELRNLGHLKLLSMKNNYLKKFEVTVVSIATLHLDNNTIGSFKGPVNLQHLTISYNSLNRLNILEKSVNLRSIDASYNNFDEFDKSLVNCKNLETLNLTKNKITDLKIEPLQQLTNLKTLKLSHNKLKTISGSATKLQIENLYLDHNELKTLNATVIKTLMPNLKQLSLTSSNKTWDCNSMTTFLNISKKSINIIDENGMPIQNIDSKRIGCKEYGSAKDDKNHRFVFWWFFLAFVIILLIILIGRYFYVRQKNKQSQNISTNIEV